MLSKQDRAMIRESARGMNGADAVNFEGAVIARLQELQVMASSLRQTRRWAVSAIFKSGLSPI
jgi:hypothetical protein